MGVKERRQLEKEKRRELILNSARNLLFTIGMKEISVSKIAKEAELGVGTLYFYFKSKEEIFAELQKEGISILYDMLEKISEKRINQDEKLVELGLSYLKFCNEEKDYFDIINYFISSSEIVFSSSVKESIDITGQKTLKIIIEVMNDGIDKGVFRKFDPKETSVMFWAMVHGLVQFRKVEKTVLDGLDHPTLYKRSVEFFVDSLKNKEAC